MSNIRVINKTNYFDWICSKKEHCVHEANDNEFSESLRTEAKGRQLVISLLSFFALFLMFTLTAYGFMNAISEYVTVNQESIYRIK